MKIILLLTALLLISAANALIIDSYKCPFGIQTLADGTKICKPFPIKCPKGTIRIGNRCVVIITPPIIRFPIPIPGPGPDPNPLNTGVIKLNPVLDNIGGSVAAAHLRTSV